MTKDQVKAVLKRVPTWPEDRQQELAEIALEIVGQTLKDKPGSDGRHELSIRLRRHPVGAVAACAAR